MAALAACGSPTQPPPPPELALSCPAPLVRLATSIEGTDVHFESPVPTGGEPPYRVECTPGSSSVFAIGDSLVECRATDAALRQVACGFTVTVSDRERLARTKFLAFGDSITEGQVSPAASFTIVDPLEAYPFKLEQMLQTRYLLQQITVVNRGKGGEETDEGLVRLPGVLAADEPEVLLLLEGTNNLTTANVSARASDLRSMVVVARQRNVDVIIATLTPIAPPHLRRSRETKPAAILEFNDRIAQIAEEFDLGAPVDLYELFQADMSLLGMDGLHPTAHGYTRIAETFSEAIAERYGQQPQSLRLR